MIFYVLTPSAADRPTRQCTDISRTHEPHIFTTKYIHIQSYTQIMTLSKKKLQLTDSRIILLSIRNVSNAT